MLVRRLSLSVLQWCWFVLCLAGFLQVSQLEVLGNSVPAMVNRSVTNLMSNSRSNRHSNRHERRHLWENIDCGTSLAAWKNQRAWAGVATGTALTNRAYVLRPGTIYYYRWYATNSTSGAATWSLDGNFDGVDDLLEAWNAAQEIHLVKAGLVNGAMLLRWNSYLGKSYQPQFKNALTDPVRLNLGNAIGNIRCQKGPGFWLEIG